MKTVLYNCGVVIDDKIWILTDDGNICSVDPKSLKLELKYCLGNEDNYLNFSALQYDDYIFFYNLKKKVYIRYDINSNELELIKKDKHIVEKIINDKLNSNYAKGIVATLKEKDMAMVDCVDYENETYVLTESGDVYKSAA